jgi:hypothetical protein
VSAPDPQRIGGLAWAQRTKGRLSAAALTPPDSRLGRDAAAITPAADAITVHATPGVTVERDGVTADVSAMIKAEANANPDGRFALLNRCGFPMLVRLNPLRPR